MRPPGLESDCSNEELRHLGEEEGRPSGGDDGPHHKPDGMGAGLAPGLSLDFVTSQLKGGHGFLLARMHAMDPFSSPGGTPSNCLFR